MEQTQNEDGEMEPVKIYVDNHRDWNSTLHTYSANTDPDNIPAEPPPPLELRFTHQEID
jgi:hypothetical protein